MAFQIRPLKEFLVRPVLPAPLSRMPELAYNVLWSWDHTIRALFRRLDQYLWHSSGHNPVRMLSQLSQSALERAAADPRYIALYRRACERFDAYMQRRNPDVKDGLVAYFCMEFGIVECLPSYSGGLGLLAGDHCRAASDLGLNFAGVGLLYQKGYFTQSLNPDGWQQERSPVDDFYTLPVMPVHTASGEELVVDVGLPGGRLYLKVWQMNVGRVKLYLLDSNISQNTNPEYRDITDQLYGGDIHTRIRQEIALGIGGMRALKALGMEPAVFHMNEGHSAFLALERIRVLIREQNLSFEEALEASRSNNVFTTHTSVPAGFDLFDAHLLREYFHQYCENAGIPFEKFLAMGRQNAHDQHERFSVAIFAIASSSFRNAVSRLHRDVSQKMFQGLWPQLPTWEVPITSVTNGVHLPTWLNSDYAALYDQYLQPDWMERYSDPRAWQHVQDIPDVELWEAHRRRKRRLINFVRERVVEAAIHRKASSMEVRRLSEVLDPNAFTIGFARRFATYKRATLIFRDLERLRRLLTSREKPVQLVIAGKAHPKDGPGKALLRDIWQLTRDPELSRRLVFIEDYSIQVGREMVQGVDIWLNNPKRGEEACGTSGMKAGINGVLNLSILDGWFDEAYENSGGWAIGDREAYAEDQDDIHASAIYSILENEIVPMFHRDREQGVPEEWMRRMKQSIMSLSPQFNCFRMLNEYRTQLYEPAQAAFRRLSAGGYQAARDQIKWIGNVQQVWDRVHFVEVGPALDALSLSGQPLPIRAVADLAGLKPEDVRVEAIVGRINPDGYLEETTVLSLPAMDRQGDFHVFAHEFVPHQTGRLGYSVRISPNHFVDPVTRNCHAPLKWA